MEYITPGAMKELESAAARYGLSTGALMENAGRGVAEVVLGRYGPGRKVCVVCGGGNNGGDGLVAARYLSARCSVQVVLLTTPEMIRTEESRGNWKLLEQTGVRAFIAEDTGALADCADAIVDAEVVVAAMFGTGVKGGVVKEPYATAIALVNRSKGAKVAIDLPSGIDPETGAASLPSVRADVTVALHLPKAGLRGSEAYTGEVVVVPIGIRGSPG